MVLRGDQRVRMVASHGLRNLPLLAETRVLGVLLVTRTDVGAWTSAEMDLAQAFADHATAALESLKASTLSEQQVGGFEACNLVGTPGEISERIRAYERVGVTTCSGLIFVANTVSEMQESIDLFGREVIPNFRCSR